MSRNGGMVSVVEVAIIGCGAITRRGHMPALSSLSDRFQVKYLVDPVKEAAQRIISEFGVGEVLEDLDGMNGFQGLAVVNAPTPVHSKIIYQLLDRGLRYIIVEKPLTLRHDDSQEIYRKAIETSACVTVVYNYRFMSQVLKLKSIIENGLLGDLLFVRGKALSKCPMGWNRSEWLYDRKVGVVYDFFPHVVDLVVWLGDGRVSRVSAYAANARMNLNFSASVEGLVEFTDKTGRRFTASLCGSWQAGVTQLVVEVIGTAGCAFLDARNDVLFCYNGVQTPFEDIGLFWTSFLSKAKGIISGRLFKGAMVTFKEFYANMYDVIRNDGEPSVKLEESLETDKILTEINSALFHGNTN
jgi:predicted dehydrogenase